MGGRRPEPEPALITGLLGWSGEQLDAYLGTVDLARPSSVYWAGEVPLWFDLAREFTERWVHYRQIREAARPAGHDEPQDEYLPLVLRTFIWGFPHQYRVPAPGGHRGRRGDPWRRRVDPDQDRRRMVPGGRASGRARRQPANERRGGLATAHRRPLRRRPRSGSRVTGPWPSRCSGSAASSSKPVLSAMILTGESDGVFNPKLKA